MGGIDLISEALLAIMTPATAAPIIAFISSILSFFSSTTGVVIPTMVPTIGTIVDSLGTGSAGFISLTSVMISSSLSSAFSPASTGGGLILAAYMAASNSENKEQEQQKLFGRLFMIAIAWRNRQHYPVGCGRIRNYQIREETENGQSKRSSLYRDAGRHQ